MSYKLSPGCGNCIWCSLELASSAVHELVNQAEARGLRELFIKTPREHVASIPAFAAQIPAVAAENGWLKVFVCEDTYGEVRLR